MRICQIVLRPATMISRQLGNSTYLISHASGASKRSSTASTPVRGPPGPRWVRRFSRKTKFDTKYAMRRFRSLKVAAERVGTLTIIPSKLFCFANLLDLNACRFESPSFHCHLMICLSLFQILITLYRSF